MTFEVAPGRVVGLIGPNGSGKSTTLRVMLGAIAPHGGAALLDGRRVDALPAATVARSIAAVLQEEASVLPMTVWDAVLLGRSVRLSGWRAYGDADRAKARQALVRTGVDHLAERSVLDLSGGERKRVLIARALAQEAEHLLLDEPTNHLDVRFQHEVLSLVRGLATTTVVVLHDLNLAARYCDELVLLDHGHVVAAGSIDEVLDPAIIGLVYGIDARRLDVDGVPQLVFSPRPMEAAG